MIAARPIALVILPGSLLWKLVLVLAGSTWLARFVPSERVLDAGLIRFIPVTSSR